MGPPLATLSEEPGGGVGEEEARARRKTGLHAALHRWAQGAHPAPLPLRGPPETLGRPPRAPLRPRLPPLSRPRPPASPSPLHNRAVQGDDGVRQDRGRRREEHVRGGAGPDGHGARPRRTRGLLCRVAARAGHVARRDGRHGARRRRRLRRP
ncbi:hypothetical protein BRADI_3g26236v3, partial [Brachypodium distachyon]